MSCLGFGCLFKGGKGEMGREGSNGSCGLVMGNWQIQSHVESLLFEYKFSIFLIIFTAVMIGKKDGVDGEKNQKGGKKGIIRRIITNNIMLERTLNKKLKNFLKVFLL